jgi:[protein-PII] uridylyltransferase
LQDQQLFDREGLIHSLKAGQPPVVVYKGALARGDADLRERFARGDPVKRLVAARAWLIDQVLRAVWENYGLSAKGLALAAVGGYGRGELHPGSDIDITLLIDPELEAGLHPRLESFLALLWDIGLEPGYSVRTLFQCQEQAAADVTIVTNLMESRLLAGEAPLFEAMRKATGPQFIWSARQFFEAKLKEQTARHHKFHHTAHNLEPNIKEGPGGLRDIQMIGWVAQRHFGPGPLHDLVHHGFLTEDEYRTLDAGRSLLWRIRFALHILTGRREDRLLFDYQRSVAKQFGFTDGEGGQLGVERFMKLYYRTVMELGRLNEMLLQLFQEAILDQDHAISIQPLNARFQVRNDYIEACHDRVFRHYPFALLEIFLLLQQHPEIKGVRASTIRLIRDHRYLIDDRFRKELKHRSLFMEILRQPQGCSDALQRMHRYGVLDAYLPVFGAVAGLMQFDLFHVYTVDVHTLFVVKNMQQLGCPEREGTLPLYTRLMAQIPKPELLYLSGLFHDIAKGRGSDHSELGAQFASEFCLQHGLGPHDTRLVAWLVKHHLLMSMTSQRRDISDPEVINAFARQIGNRVRLDYLYLLTVADICGTNPSLWNSWKDALLTELYDNTLRALRRGVENPLEREEWIAETRGEALALLCRADLNKGGIIALWKDLGDDYFLRHWPDEIAWHTRAILNATEGDLPLVLVREQTRLGGTAIFIYAQDQDHIFAAATRTLEQLGLTILDARIITSVQGYTLDTYIVLEAATNEVIRSAERVEELVTLLKAKLTSETPISPQVNRRQPRQLKYFRIPTEISFSDDSANVRTIMEVVGTDRPGFLAQVAMALQLCGVRLQNAKIATFGERVEDIFYITDIDGRPIRDTLKLECLHTTLTQALSPLMP